MPSNPKGENRTPSIRIRRRRTMPPLLHKNEKSKKLIFSHGILKKLRCGRPEGGKPDAAHQNQQVLRSSSSSAAKTSKKHVRDFKKISKKSLKIDAAYTIRCRMYMIGAMPVLIWSETDQNTPFLNKRSKTLKKTRARRQKNRNF